MIVFKGKVSRVFWLQVFFMTYLPPNPWKQHKGHFNFLRKFTEIFASQGGPLALMTPAANLLPLSSTSLANLPQVSTTPATNLATGTAGVVDTGGKFATSVSDTGSKFTAVSTTPVAWQIMGIISDCWHLKVNLKEIIDLYVSSTTKRCRNKNNLNFSDLRFFTPLVSTTPVVHLELRISLGFRKYSKQH